MRDVIRKRTRTRPCASIGVSTALATARATALATGLAIALGAGATLGLVTMAGPSAAASPTKTTTPPPAPPAPATSVSFSFTATITGLATTAATITGNGQASFVSDDVGLTVTLPAAVTALLPGGSSAPEVVEAVIASGTVYLNIPSLGPLVGAPWISIALPSTATTGIPADFTEVATALGNVSTIVTYAEAHGGTVTSLGKSHIDGTKVTGEKIVAILGHGKKSTVHKLVAKTWANPSEQLVQATVTTTGSTKKGPLGIVATAAFTGYDAAVTINTPPPAEVRAIPFSLIEGLLGGGTSHAAG